MQQDKISKHSSANLNIHIKVGRDLVQFVRIPNPPPFEPIKKAPKILQHSCGEHVTSGRGATHVRPCSGSSVGHMKPKGCPVAKNGCLGGKATTWEAAGYILNMATAQAGPLCRLPVFYSVQ